MQVPQICFPNWSIIVTGNEISCVMEPQVFRTELDTKFQQISSRERIRQRYFPNLVLTDQNGRKLKFYDDVVKDRIVIFNMYGAARMAETLSWVHWRKERGVTRS